MIELEVLKAVIDQLPISGDIVDVLKNKTIFYESGRELPFDNPRKLTTGDKVRSVRHEFYEKTDELLITIEHQRPSGFGWLDRIIHPNLKKIQRRLKLEKLDRISKATNQMEE